MNAITAGALTRADPKLKFVGKDKLPKRDRKSYRQNRTNLYITQEFLQPLPLISDYEDLAGSEAIKLVVCSCYYSILIQNPVSCGTTHAR